MLDKRTNQISPIGLVLLSVFWFNIRNYAAPLYAQEHATITGHQACERIQKFLPKAVAKVYGPGYGSITGSNLFTSGITLSTTNKSDRTYEI